ncbi:snare associated golgi family protein [Leptolyngbya sp. Heron Island J]|uniref:TVP38/TMEM64 family protein n=1 Tax=Leptolyngbya sp. Heron Island J TaxID=1385935 RepID=UPI0003B9DBDE|nr:VTT domain-containing protein [Leptolyngbya sp. Heron Island J]ESA32596.1 snare associated golgi family protein [Leptolyngbya sp. Heron Island J]
MNSKYGKWLRLVGIAIATILIIWVIQRYGISQLHANVENLGVWAPLVLFFLRFTSVIIPALPGTAYSILAGGLLGFSQGLLVICIADLCSCSLSFFLSRQFGRSFVKRLVGEKFITRVDTLSQKHLERNFFLMTAFLMTGFFDFVAYAIGLTQASWLCFIPALALSILISNPPIVALGAGLLAGGKLLLAFAMLGAFALALLTGFLQRKQPIA